LTRVLSLWFSIILLVGNIYADENIVDYSDTSLPVLNEELRNLHDGVRNTHSIPSGGTAGQVLVKDTATNYDTSWATINTGGIQIFTSSGIFTAPAGVTKVYISGCGAGGGGGEGSAAGAATGSGGGGASGKCVVNYPYTVVPTTAYTVTLNAGGNGGASDGGDTGNPGVVGGTSVFDALTLAGGLFGTGGGAVSVQGIGGGINTNVLGMSSPGANGVSNTVGGNGGGGLFGVGGVGATNSAGTAGAVYGGGGGGGSGSGGGANGYAGGAGAKGIIIVEYN